MSEWKALREMPPLSNEEASVLRDSATESPFAGKYVDFTDRGVYLCRQCGNALYRSEAKFASRCGWPSFDIEIPDSVAQSPDPDGTRVEIRCANCLGHLGHVFEGEGLTARNTRHCVNSLSLFFLPTKKALFAGGCFWGIEGFFSNREGVVTAISGYAGGWDKHPTYREVCTGGTGHAETVLIEFEPEVVSFERLAKDFFEHHDPTTLDRQGPDIGRQYRSAVFCCDREQRETILRLTARLCELDKDVVTEVLPEMPFYQAEGYHQHYFRKHPSREGGSCHYRRNIDW